MQMLHTHDVYSNPRPIFEFVGPAFLFVLFIHLLCKAQQPEWALVLALQVCSGIGSLTTFCRSVSNRSHQRKPSTRMNCPTALISCLFLAVTAFRQQVQSIRQCFDDQLRTVLADVLLLMSSPQSSSSSTGNGLAGTSYDVHVRALGLGLRDAPSGEFPECLQACCSHGSTSSCDVSLYSISTIDISQYVQGSHNSSL